MLHFKIAANGLAVLLIWIQTGNWKQLARVLKQPLVEWGLVTSKEVFVGTKYIHPIVTALHVQVLVAFMKEVFANSCKAFRVRYRFLILGLLLLWMRHACLLTGQLEVSKLKTIRLLIKVCSIALSIFNYQEIWNGLVQFLSVCAAA